MCLTPLRSSLFNPMDQMQQFSYFSTFFRTDVLKMKYNELSDECASCDTCYVVIVQNELLKFFRNVRSASFEDNICWKKDEWQRNTYKFSP
jgi:hypothetical protein